MLTFHLFQAKCGVSSSSCLLVQRPRFSSIWGLRFGLVLSWLVWFGSWVIGFVLGRFVLFLGDWFCSWEIDFVLGTLFVLGWLVWFASWDISFVLLSGDLFGSQQIGCFSGDWFCSWEISLVKVFYLMGWFYSLILFKHLIMFNHINHVQNSVL